MGGHRPWVKKNNLAADAAVKAAHAPLFQKYGVDLYLAGHVHAYSRHLPKNAANGETALVVTGGAGCDEGLEGNEKQSGVDGDWDWYADGTVHQVGTLEVSKSKLTWKAHNSD